MSENDAPAFPSDLTALQTPLHQARAELEVFSRTLAWSVEPMPDWGPRTNGSTGEIIEPGREPQPGYTPEQLAEDTRLWALVRDLSDRVSTHPHWGTFERGPALVDARIALKSHPETSWPAGPWPPPSAGGGHPWGCR
ncbi:hypothetical protein ACGFYZ_33405 [Streptomyces sp. NPDC048330]|uniref:hypothetical protein n=1 Tax=Streptomyces sp. NPDC048330 TaxID=3365533 RepID=UPI00372138F0